MKAEKFVLKLKSKASRQDFASIPEIALPELTGGIEVQTQHENFTILGDQLNEQANLLDDWREELVALLTKPLLDEEEDVEGNEFEESVRQSDEIYAYVDGIKALLADRTHAITGVSNILVEHELKRQLEIEGATADKLRQLLHQRQKVHIDVEANGTIKDVVNKMMSLRTRLAGAETGSERSLAEKALVEEQLKEMRRVVTEQTAALKELEKEINLYRAAINARIDFHKQLQTVSTSVESHNPNPELPEDRLDKEWTEAEKAEFVKKDQQELKKLLKSEGALKPKVMQARSRLKYLYHLHNDPTAKDSNPECLICASNFTVGLLTECGHYFCKDCLLEWWKSHRRCPQCRTALRRDEMYNVTYVYPPSWSIKFIRKFRKLTRKFSFKSVSEEKKEVEESPRKRSEDVIYKSMESWMMQEINRVELNIAMGSKIDMCEYF